MYLVHGTTISLVRGDTFVAYVHLTRGDEDYIPSEGDIIRFVMQKSLEVTPRLIKIIPNDTLELHLLPEDTKDLPVGLYYYDMEIEFEDHGKDTFINRGTLHLLSDVCRE